MPQAVSTPWRAPATGRPELPLPPRRMPLLANGVIRKRWRYVAAFADPLMLCIGRAQVGPFWQTFWAIWDRERSELHERTRISPRGRGEVSMTGEFVRVNGSGVEVELRFDLAAVEPVEAICPSGSDGWGWTRKLADVPVTGRVALGRREIEIDCRGVEDLSAGYHTRHTSWFWSAGVGTTVDGDSVGWNLVQGINDPPHASERGIWLNGAAKEPDPVEFDDLDGIGFADGSRVEFAKEAERARDERVLIFRSEYVQPFGTFTGTLDGGIALERGFGVMERHVAVW